MSNIFLLLQISTKRKNRFFIGWKIFLVYMISSRFFYLNFLWFRFSKAEKVCGRLFTVRIFCFLLSVLELGNKKGVLKSGLESCGTERKIRNLFIPRPRQKERLLLSFQAFDGLTLQLMLDWAIDLGDFDAPGVVFSRGLNWRCQSVGSAHHCK